MIGRLLQAPSSRRREISRRTRVLAAVTAGLAVFVLGLQWGTRAARRGSSSAIERAYRERLVRWRQARMGGQPDVRVGTRLPLLAATSAAAGDADAPPTRTLLLFVGDAPG